MSKRKEPPIMPIPCKKHNWGQQLYMLVEITHRSFLYRGKDLTYWTEEPTQEQKYIVICTLCRKQEIRKGFIKKTPYSAIKVWNERHANKD